MQKPLTNLIGRLVVFSLTPTVVLEGVIEDKIDMIQKPGDNFTVTGYIIKGRDNSQLYTVAYWRLQSVILEDGAKEALDSEIVK